MTSGARCDDGTHGTAPTQWGTVFYSRGGVSTGVIPPDSRDRLVLIAIGLLVLLAPALILVVTLGTLVLLGDLAFGQLTPVEFLELYLIDLVLFFVLAYGVYRLTLWLVKRQVPVSLESLESREDADSSDDGLTRPEDR